MQKYDGPKPGTDSFSKLANGLYQKAKKDKARLGKQHRPKGKLKVK